MEERSEITNHQYPAYTRLASPGKCYDINDDVTLTVITCGSQSTEPLISEQLELKSTIL